MLSTALRLGSRPIKLNHPRRSDVVSDPVHVAGYGNGFEGTIVVRVVDDSENELAARGLVKKTGDLDEVGEFYGDIELKRMPSEKTGIVEAWGSSGRNQDDRVGFVRVPVAFGANLVRA